MPSFEIMATTYYFKTILIPVDFKINTEVAVKKAVELAEDGSIIHLFHVQSYGLSSLPFQFFKGRKERIESGSLIEKKLQEWKTAIQEFNPAIEVFTSVTKSKDIQGAIEKKATQTNADLVIIGKKSHRTWLPFLNTVTSSKIAEHTGKAVLTSKPAAMHNKIRKLVVPINGAGIFQKTDVIKAITRTCNLKIHLVTFPDTNKKPTHLNVSPLLDIYQWLKSTTHCQVEYAVLHGNNKAKAILKFAEKINADVLLVLPKGETKAEWETTHIADIIPARSKVQVLTI